MRAALSVRRFRLVAIAAAAALLASTAFYAASAPQRAKPAPAERSPAAHAAEEFLLFAAAAGPQSCEGSEIFGADDAFSCDRAACIQAAHDRSEAACPANCARYFSCTKPAECGGQATFCLEPQVLEFKLARCPSGMGYHCSGACRCACSCGANF